MNGFYEAMEKRRSIYGISNEKIVSEDRIIEVVSKALKHTPSSFNSQSGRVVILFDDNHKKLWDITTETLRKITPEDKFAATLSKMEMFSSGYGTILIFEEMETVENLKANFPLYADKFEEWSNHSSGMLQYVIWTSLENEGLGATLQHYNPLIDEEVKATYDLPKTWKLIAQMPFGKPTAPAGNKEFMELEKRIKVFK